MRLASVVIIGAGPAGLMAAEVLSREGVLVNVYDAMPSAGRKFLQAGRGGLNITHINDFSVFMSAYAEQQSWLSPMIAAFDNQAIQLWMKDLGVASFVGSSGRVFPDDKKAAPLLRAWLHRLRKQGVVFHMKHRFVGWHETEVQFETPIEKISVAADAVVLALGGASWPALGSDGRWVELLSRQGITVSPLKPANCSFVVPWSEYLVAHYAGHPIKPVVLSYQNLAGEVCSHKGELMLSASGLEGGLIYQVSAPLREAILSRGEQIIYLDLMPDWSNVKITRQLSKQSKSLSLVNQLKRGLKLTGVKVALLNEYLINMNTSPDITLLPFLIKKLPIKLISVGSLAEAISTAGGVSRSEFDVNLMLQRKPGVFCAGEMLDWEAPTGGYLLTAVLATGRHAACGVLKWLKSKR